MEIKIFKYRNYEENKDIKLLMKLLLKNEKKI